MVTALLSKYLLPAAGLLLGLAALFIWWQQSTIDGLEDRVVVAEVEASSARDAIRILQEAAKERARIEASIREIADGVEAANRALEEQEPPDVLADPNLVCFAPGAIR